MTAATPPAVDPDASARAPWYQRRGVLVAVGAAVVVAVAVVTDLPTPASHASDVAGATAFVKEVNQDLAPCDFAVTESFQLRQDQLAGHLTPSEHQQLPSLFNDDEVACSYAGPAIQDLVSLESPGTAANTQLGQMLASATQWATYDALQAIDQIQLLAERPANARALRRLDHDVVLLAHDRAAARRAMASADVAIHAALVEVALPVEPPSGA
jgi:hypothetical protein